MRAIQAKAKFCEHFQIEWDHSMPLIIKIKSFLLLIVTPSNFKIISLQLILQNLLFKEVLFPIKHKHVTLLSCLQEPMKLNSILGCLESLFEILPGLTRLALLNSTHLFAKDSWKKYTNVRSSTMNMNQVTLSMWPLSISCWLEYLP